MTQTTFIVAIAIDGETTDHQIVLFLARTTSAEQAKAMVMPRIGELKVLVSSVTSLHDYAKNIFDMQDETIGSLPR